MTSRIVRATLIIGAVFLTGACASSDEWAEWRKHSTHFASGHHGMFSLRHPEGSAPRVSRIDVDASRRENWWGKAVTVNPDQIFQN
jgi:hypothetical protein